MFDPDVHKRFPGARRTFDGSSSWQSNSIRGVIYCVVPEPLAADLFDKLSRYYSNDPDVTVIVDRRKSSRRGRASSAGGQRKIRDRRRARVPGELPALAGE